MLGGSSQSWKKQENRPRDCEEGGHAVQRHGNPLLQTPMEKRSHFRDPVGLHAFFKKTESIGETAL